MMNQLQLQLMHRRNKYSCLKSVRDKLLKARFEGFTEDARLVMEHGLGVTSDDLYKEMKDRGIRMMALEYAKTTWMDETRERNPVSRYTSVNGRMKNSMDKSWYE